MYNESSSDTGPAVDTHTIRQTVLVGPYHNFILKVTKIETPNASSGRGYGGGLGSVISSPSRVRPKMDFVYS